MNIYEAFFHHFFWSEKKNNEGLDATSRRERPEI